MKKQISTLILLFAVGFSFGQAFKGKGDMKLQVGATLQQHATGIVTTYDYGLGENISIGGQISYLLNTTDAAGTPKFDDRFDAKFRFNANIGNVLNISDKFDLYPGLNIGLRNFGTHLGARYFFTNGFGIFTEAAVPLAKYNTDAVGYERFNNQFVFQIGASFNL
jgi:outer membrane protein G